jgi:predicted transcriptional regulator
MDSEKPIISFRIRSDIKEALQELAQADRRSLSSYIELALEAHVEAHRSRLRAAPLDRPLLRQLVRAKQTKKS